MALRRVNIESDRTDDVPWANEYLDRYPEAQDEAFFVRKLIVGSKGFMVITDDFKAFLFRDSSLFLFLLEAIKLWTARASYSQPLYSTLSSGGRISLAIDDEEEESVWICTKKDKIWEQKRKKEQADGLEGTVSNPFIVPPPPTTKPKKGNSQSRTRPVDETSL